MALVKHIVQEGQSIFDVVLQKYGTLDNLFSIFVNNPSININSVLEAQTDLLIDTEIVGQQQIKTEFLLKSYVTNNNDDGFISLIPQKQFQNGEPFNFMNDEPFIFN